MADEPKEEEIAVELIFHHGPEVKLDIGGADHGEVVSQEAKLEPVGHKAP